MDETNKTTKRKAPTFEPSTDRLILANLLKKRFIEDHVELVSYDEIQSALGGRDIRNGARYLLSGARADFTRDHHIATVIERNEGVRISHDPSGCLDASIRHIRRTARRTSKTAAHVLANENLEPIQRQGILCRTAQLGVLAQFAGRAALKQIEGKINNESTEPLALLPTIDALREQFVKT